MKIQSWDWVLAVLEFPLKVGKNYQKTELDSQTQSLGVDLFNIFRKIQNRAVVCTSNLGDGGNETIIKGLVCGHAYRND